MTVKQQLVADMKGAMREKNVVARDTLRMLLAAIKQVEVDSGAELDDAGVLAVLAKQAKQRKESISEYENAGREDLAAPEKEELAVIEQYLPKQMSRDEIRVVAAEVVAQTGVTDIKGMGQVMGRLMGRLKGKADGRLINEVVRELLSG